jgi:hypothetical protein
MSLLQNVFHYTPRPCAEGFFFFAVLVQTGSNSGRAVHL